MRKLTYRNIPIIIHDARSEQDTRITRDTFLFMTPTSEDQKEQFAQCLTCRMFVPGKYFNGKVDGDRCVAHGSKQEVDEEMSCGVYVAWPNGTPNEEDVKGHTANLLKGMPGAVTAEESGLVNRRVQCRRCKFANQEASECGLYEKLNQSMPEIFNLVTEITPNSCCNAQEPEDE